MKLRVLVDNNTFIDDYYYGEPGLSFYIEDNNTKILFDTGYSDIFEINAKKMNIDLSKINYLVISHGHNDHTGGLAYIKDKLESIYLIAHPDVFLDRSHYNKEIGSPVKLNDIKVKKFIDGTHSYKITDKLYFLGQIERKTNFEAKTLGILSNGDDDYLYDDTALAYKSEDGIFIITACSHAGICNICEQAKKILNDDRIIGIIGGFHLREVNNQLKETIKYFEENNIKDLYPCHCVCLMAKCLMKETLNIHEVGVGLELNIK